MKNVLQVGKKGGSNLSKILKKSAGLVKKKGISLSEMLAELDEVRHNSKSK